MNVYRLPPYSVITEAPGKAGKPRYTFSTDSRLLATGDDLPTVLATGLDLLAKENRAWNAAMTRHLKEWQVRHELARYNAFDPNI